MDTLDPTTLRAFPNGVNNITPDNELPLDTLRDGVNVDIYNGGKIRRRAGYTSTLSLTDGHSLWHNHRSNNPTEMYYAQGSSLFVAKNISGTLTHTSVVTNLQLGATVAYADINGEVFWTNGTLNGRIVNGVNYDWGVETPARQPTLETTSVGFLDAGIYQIAITYRTAAGEESGSTIAASITMPTQGGIALSNIPVANSILATHVCIYVSSTNGNVLRRLAVISRGITTYTISSPSTTGVQLKTQFLQPMPAGTAIANVGGVVYVASGPYVFHSEPLRYGLCDISTNFYAFPTDVTMLLAVPNGLYVCADKTYFISNPGTENAPIVPVLQFGAIRGTGVYLPDGVNVAWFSPRGQVIGSTGGAISMATVQQYAPGVMMRGASLFREYRGLRQIINTVVQSDVNQLEYTGD